MININKHLQQWLKDFKEFDFRPYEEHTEIELYMDQVLTYLERQLKLFNYSSSDKQISSSRINNYVKDGVITAPIKKKYNRKHLALIEEVCTLKNVLTIAETKQILDSSYKGHDNAEVFNEFKAFNKALNNRACDEAISALEGIEENDVKNLNDLALKMALVSNAYNQISKRILYLTKIYEDNLDEEVKQNKENE